jgi:tetratricopeptide (TPR) repeat protein
MDDTAAGNAPSPASHDALKDAEELLRKGDTTASFDKVRNHWLAHPDDMQAAQLLSRIVEKSGRTELSTILAALSQSPQKLETDPQLLFDTGYLMIEERQFHLAAMLLARAVAACPDQPAIHYELGFALMSVKRYDDAIMHFEKVVTLDEDFDSHLNLAACYALTRDLEKTRHHIDRLLSLSETSDTSKVGSKDEIQKELSNRKLVLRRLELMQQKPAFNLRDWFFTLYGAILLEDQSLSGLAQADAVGGEMYKVAEAVLAMRGCLEAVGLEFDMIEYHSTSARPLAEALARLIDLPVEPISDFSRTDRTLLIVAWGEELIDSFRMLNRNDGYRVIFAYGVPKDSPLPITPDIVAHVLARCDLPWHEELLEHQAKDLGPLSLPDEAMAALVDQLVMRCSEIEGNPKVIRHCADLSDYFGPKKKLLTLGNQESIPERPEYTAEMPVV